MDEQTLPETGRMRDGSPPPHSLSVPPTRREVLLFGLLLFALGYLFLGARPRAVHVVPESAVQLREITLRATAPPGPAPSPVEAAG